MRCVLYNEKIWVFTHRHHSWCFLGTVEAYREVMMHNGDGDKPVAITQFGWGVSNSVQPGYEFARDNTPEEQAQWTVEAYQWAKVQGWIGPMMLWNLDYGVTMPDTPTFEALVKMLK